MDVKQKLEDIFIGIKSIKLNIISWLFYIKQKTNRMILKYILQHYFNTSIITQRTRYSLNDTDTFIIFLTRRNEKNSME